MRIVKLFLFFLFLGVLACGGQSKAVGLWQMGPLTSATSSAETQFPAQKWADSLSSGADFVALTDDGKIYSRTTQETTLLEGAWSKEKVEFSFDGKSEKGLTMTTSFTGVYNASSDTIEGTLHQKLTLSQGVPLEFSAQVSFSRVPL